MNIKHPLPRSLRNNICNPSIHDLIDLAFLRVQHIVQPNTGSLPPVPFPLAESMRWDFFTFHDWGRYGNLETEYARLTYTLSCYPERGSPAACENVLRDLLGQSSVLAAWPAFVPDLNKHAAAALSDVVQRLSIKSSGRTLLEKFDFVTVPVDYEVCTSQDLLLRLWERSLDEMARWLITGHPTSAIHFLQIHAYLKDPIYGLAKSFHAQQFYFGVLLGRLQSTLGVQSADRSGIKKVVAQAAQESSYLANRLLDNVMFVHFQNHYQLTYVNVLIDSLARAEFSVPLHVLEVMEEMLLAVAANNGQACPLVPILVTTYPAFSNPDHCLVPIIDGNHRVTAVILLRFLAGKPLLDDVRSMSQLLVEYCKLHHLGKKWQVDLLDVLRELYEPSNRQYHGLLSANIPLVCKFASVRIIPALLVQEENFHTICKQRSVGKPRPVLLHPFHQTLFNDEDLPFALPQKAGQTHGRPEAFRLLPLVPFGSAEDGEEAYSGRDFAAQLRQSMNGLTREGSAVSGLDVSTSKLRLDVRTQCDQDIVV